MNTEFEEDIENIISNIKKLNESLNIDSQDNTNEVKKAPKIYGGSNYHLQQHQWKQKCIEFKKDLKRYPNGKVTDYDVLENTANLIDIININEYKKTWTRLDNYQKKKKLTEFITELVNKDKLSIDNSKTLLLKLQILVNNKKINKSKDVDYCKEICKIKSIKTVTILDNKDYILLDN